MYKKVIAVFIAVLLTVACLPFSVFADDETEPDDRDRRISELENELAMRQAEIAALYTQISNEDQLAEYLQQILQRLDNPTPPPATFPRLIIKETTIINLRAASVTARLGLTNIGVGPANNVNIKLEVTGDMPFAAILTGGTSYYRSIPANKTSELHLRIIPGPEAKAGLYGLPLTYTYTDEGGTERKDTDIIFIRIEKDALPKNEPANIMVSEIVNSNAVIMPEDAFTLTALIENIGDNPASGVQTVIDGLDPEGVYLDTGSGSHTWREIAKTSRQTAAFNLKAAKDAGGVYALTFKVTWLTEGGESKEASFPYFVVVTRPPEEDGRIQIKTGEITAPAGDLTPARDFIVTIPVINTGEVKADVTVTADITAETAIVPRSSNIVVIDGLMPGETRNVSFTFMATDEAQTRNYAIGFVFISGEGEDAAVFTQYVGVNINNPKKDEDEKDGEKPKSTPKIIISRYESDPVIAKAGENFNLSMTFLNTHRERAIKNVKAFITAEVNADGKGNVFVPVDASNTFYIDEITPGAQTERHLSFYTIPEAEPRYYVINVNFEYEDEDGEKITAVEQVGIHVKQIARIDTGDINIPQEGYVGSPVSVYFDFYNTGKVTFTNLIINIEGDFDVSNTRSYYSNFQPGNSDYYDMFFTPTTPGLVSGNIVLQFEDSAGEQMTEYKPFEINVMDMSFDYDMGGWDERDMYPPMEEEQGGFMNFIKRPVVIISGSAALFVIIVVIIVSVHRSRRKRREMEIDE